MTSLPALKKFAVALPLLVGLAGCGGRAAPEPTGAIAPPAAIELPQEAVPPGVRPISREVEDLGQP